MSNEKVEWVEIIEPKTKEHIYANLTTGECVWDPPLGVPVKKTDNKQWWELFDQNTGRFYYYNATSQKTVWHRPQNCDIIPLAKLQTLKQNTEVTVAAESENSTTPRIKKPCESVATQTPGRSALQVSSTSADTKSNQSLAGGSTVSSRTSGVEGSPKTSSNRSHHHHHHHRHQEGCRGDGKTRRGSQGSCRQNQNHTSQQDSGRSSDSSSVSVCRQQGGAVTEGGKLAPSPSTPLLKKRSPTDKANSFDINISIGGGYSLSQENRGGGSRSRPQPQTQGIARSHSFALRQIPPRPDSANNNNNDDLHSFLSTKSAESPLEKESYKSLQKLSPEYANVGTPSSGKVNQETNTGHVVKHTREASSDMEDMNGAWPLSSYTRKTDNSADSDKRSDVGSLGLDSRSLEMWNSAASGSHNLPLHHYILEQAQLSGYRFGGQPEEDDSPLGSDVEDPRITRTLHYDSDEFADDEAMSQVSSGGLSEEEDDGHRRATADTEETTDEEEARYMNTGVDYACSDHHYSDAADYMESCVRRQHGASLFYNTRLSQHTVRPITTPSPSPVSYETQHTSLKRNRDVQPVRQPLYSPIMERNEPYLVAIGEPYYSAHSLPNSPSPMATSFQYERLARMALTRERKLPSDSDIEKYAQDHLNVHKKGIFRKKFSVRELLSWSKDPISKPMLVLSDKALKKEAREVFKLVQMYMGDRKLKVGTTLDSVLLEITSLAHSKAPLRDELFIQICRQTTDNPRKESLRRGWELMAICLYFFPPSPKFQAYLESYMNRHRDPSYDFPEVGKWPIHVQVSHYASVACKRLLRIGAGGRRPVKKPTLEEIEQARVQIFRPSMFGCTLEEVMALQKSRFPHYKLPWVQTTLSDEVLRLQGTHTEGIFRVSADIDEVCSLKQQLDRWERPSEYTDAHTPASLLKLWYRELYEPLIPDSLYEDCIQCHDDAEQAAAIVDTLPALNKMVLAYLIRFLQIFARPEVVAVTKMDASNLAMVMAPNCLRCCCQEPRVMYENARKEMAFIRTLILNFDTGFMQGVL